MENIFLQEVTSGLIQRINKLTSNSTPQWGKMAVGQMLAHCSVPYEMALEGKGKKASGILKFILRLFLKNIVVGEKPYAKNGRTAPEFLITEPKEFDSEKRRLISYIEKAQLLGESYFEGKESNSFGALSAKEWSNLFYKHLDHHLNQFGV